MIIICADEPEQQKVYEALAADGCSCRVVVDVKATVYNSCAGL